MKIDCSCSKSVVQPQRDRTHIIIRRHCDHSPPMPAPFDGRSCDRGHVEPAQVCGILVTMIDIMKQRNAVCLAMAFTLMILRAPPQLSLSPA